jgi:hypothetical protein
MILVELSMTERRMPSATPRQKLHVTGRIGTRLLGNKSTTTLASARRSFSKPSFNIKIRLQLAQYSFIWVRRRYDDTQASALLMVAFERGVLMQPLCSAFKAATCMQSFGSAHTQSRFFFICKLTHKASTRSV